METPGGSFHLTAILNRLSKPAGALATWAGNCQEPYLPVREIQDNSVIVTDNRRSSTVVYQIHVPLGDPGQRI